MKANNVECLLVAHEKHGRQSQQMWEGWQHADHFIHYVAPAREVVA